MIRRLEQEPTDEQLLQSIQKDRAGRNRDIIEFIRILSDTEGPYSYMIDAPWGDGKTFFVKSINLILNAVNPQITNQDKRPAELQEIYNALKDVDISILPFYFNAWSNDFVDDPITALFSCMAAEFDGSEFLKDTHTIQAITAIVDIALSIARAPLSVSTLANAASSESLIGAFKKREVVRLRIQELCEKTIKEVANTLVIFIDELDRCRPDFAVRLLEQTKNLFDSTNTILVFSTDSVQLAKAIGGTYGPGFNSSRYLERFYDERITMSTVDAYSFAHDNTHSTPHNRFDRLVSEIIKSQTFTIRDAYRIKNKLELARDYCLNHNHTGLPHVIASYTVLPLLVFIEHEDTDLFRRITQGNDPDAVFDYGQAYTTFIDITWDLLTQFHQADASQQSPEEMHATCKQYMHDLCRAIYGLKPGDPDFYTISNQIGNDTFASFDPRIYKQLTFE